MAATDKTSTPRAASGARARSSGRWSEARLAVLAAAGSRLLLVVVALVTTMTIGVRERALHLRYPEHAEALSGVAKRLFEPWAHWDGVWYVRIAADGYAAHENSQAFFPLYPLVLRALAPLAGGSYVIPGVVFSLVCYAGAMAILYRLAKDELGPRVALWSVAFISVFPTALVFQGVYSESLFLVLALACFAAARSGRWFIAGLAGLLAAMTRSSGLVLLVPLAIMWWEQRQGVPFRLPWGQATGMLPARRPRLSSAAWLLLVPAGLGLYMAYLWRVFGDPLQFGVAQRHWDRWFELPWTTVWMGAEKAAESFAALAAMGPSTAFGTKDSTGGIAIVAFANVFEFVGFLAALALVAVCWRKLPAAYAAYAAAALLFPLFYPAEQRPLSALPRFVLVDFPLFIALAVVLVPRPILRWVVTAVMLALLVVGTVYFISWS